jgi:hypothetical protein
MASSRRQRNAVFARQLMRLVLGLEFRLLLAGFDSSLTTQCGIEGRLVFIFTFQTTIAAAGTDERLFPKCRALVRPIKCVQSDHPVNA